MDMGIRRDAGDAVTFALGQLVVIKRSQGTSVAIAVQVRDPNVAFCVWRDSSGWWTKPRKFDAADIIERDPRDARARRAAAAVDRLELQDVVGRPLAIAVRHARNPQVEIAAYTGPMMVVAPAIGTLFRLRGEVWEVASPIDEHQCVNLRGYDDLPTMYKPNGRKTFCRVDVLAGAEELRDA
jgi:hypothetical protein